MASERNRKLIRLTRILRKMGAVCIAFSGGADSAFLLAVAVKLKLPKLLAVAAVGDLMPRAEKKALKRYPPTRGMKLRRFHYQIPGKVRVNSLKRCYYCKKAIFERIKRIAKKENISFVLDGSNKDDRKDLRPGRKALRELGVRSPLEEAGLSKKDIRFFSKKMGLATADKISGTCLATRIPRGEKIVGRVLKKIDAAEDFLRVLGIACVRVRCHQGVLARIETVPEGMKVLLANQKKITRKLKALGFTYVAMDLSGYKGYGLV